MIIADSSVLSAFAIKSDQNHVRARELLTKFFSDNTEKVLVPDAIFYETMTVVSVRTKSIKTASDFGRKLADSVSLVFAEKDLFDQTFNLFSEQKNSKLSFADCMLVALSRTLGVEKIATFDEEFKKVSGITVVD